MTPWALFLGAGWTGKRPKKPGRYPVATREGDPLDPVKSRVIDVSGKELAVAPGEPGWQGLWWRLPYPQMRPAREEER